MLADMVHPDQTYTIPGHTIFDNLPQFVGFLQVLYASIECLVRLNWTLTEPVSFGRGVQQGCPLSGQLYALAIEPFLCLLLRRLMWLVLREPELRLVLSAYANDVVQDPGNLAWVESCQAIYSAASPARVSWVNSSGLVVGDRWQASSLPPALQAISSTYDSMAVQDLTIVSYITPCDHADFGVTGRDNTSRLSALKTYDPASGANEESL
ncbi:unnamed protein product [Caretta caretta]